MAGENCHLGPQEIYVFDMRSGDIILQWAQDLHLPMGSTFLLQRDKILVAYNGIITSAKFWI